VGATHSAAENAAASMLAAEGRALDVEPRRFRSCDSLRRGLFEHILGRVANRHGIDAARLVAHQLALGVLRLGYAHLALVFAEVIGQEKDTAAGCLNAAELSRCRA